MDGFNNMGADSGLKADINVVDAPTAQNVVMDAPEPAPEAFPGSGSEVIPETVSEPEVQPSPEAVTEPVTESVSQTSGFSVQSQEDYFASAFNYGGTGNSNDSYAAATGYDAQNSYGGTDGYGTQSTYGNAAGYGTQSTYGNAAGYDTQGTYGSAGGYGAQNTYGSAGGYGAQNTYGNAGGYGTNAYGTGNSYSAPNSAYAGYNSGYPSNQEYSGPDYYGSNVYANDAFASYYEDEPERKSNGLAIGALVCGIVSLSLTCSGFGLIPGIIAIILGVRGSKECEKVRMANIGMILGIIGCLVNLIRFIGLILQLVPEIMELF